MKKKEVEKEENINKKIYEINRQIALVKIEILKKTIKFPKIISPCQC